MNEHCPTFLTHETLQQMPSIKKNEWQRRRFFTFCSLIDVFWPLPHTVEKKMCLPSFQPDSISPQCDHVQILANSTAKIILSSKSLNQFLSPYCWFTHAYAFLSEIVHEFYNLFVSQFYYSIKFRYCEKATKFEKKKNLPLFLKLLGT